MRAVFASGLIGFLIAVSSSAAASAETLVESNVDSRLVLAFRVPAAELKQWLPAQWQASAVPAGPSQGANLLVVFFQRMLSQAADGKPSAAGGTDQGVALAVPAKGPDGADSVLVTRIYTPYSAGLPGPYKNGVHANVRRELVLTRDNLSPGTATDHWELKLASGGTMMLRVAYERPVPSRARVETKPRSAVDPNFFRIYRVDQGVEVLKSAPAKLDRIRAYEFHSDVPELAKMLDGRQELISVTALPWYVRQVSLPSAQ